MPSPVCFFYGRPKRPNEKFGRGKEQDMALRESNFIKTYGTVLLGGAVFALGFNWFLLPF